VEHETTPFVVESERPLVRDALIGIVVGVFAFALVSTLIVRLGWPDQTWGFALTIGAFAGPWAGLFFGSAAGIAYSQAKAAKSHTADTTAPAAPAAPAVPPAAIPVGTV
jgi:hypothetical protein